MPPNQDTSKAGADLLELEVIDLEPTVQVGAIPGWADPEVTGEARTRNRPALVAGGPGDGASFSGHTSDLLRSRLGLASLFLAVVYAMLLSWVLATGDDVGHRLVWVLMASRFVVAATVAGLMLRPVALTASQVRWGEYGLFGGLTVILVISQYLVNRDLLLLKDVTGATAYMKNGIIQMFALMVLYGMFLPNKPRNTAAVVLTMALAPLLSLALLMEDPALVDTLHHLRTTEHAGSNLLFLLIGAALAIFGSHVLNGLRVELHEAQKFGQYRLLRKIGSGGMGEVYLAEHQLLKRPCALKLIKPDAVSNPVALGRFEREVRSAARLAHPNTIEIYDYGHSADHTFYYVMEYLEGLSLHDLVARVGPLPAGRTVYLIRQACAGLAEAHAIGLVHRDLKPANIFIARHGGETDVVKVLDFGLVKLTKDPTAPALTAELTVSGTPSFMAPEQATASRDLDSRADIYALGAIAYYVLTGQPPFSGETAFAIMMAHARDAVVPPTELRPEIPADLEAVILKCLAKKPDDRYTDARELSRALAACECARDWDGDRADAWWANAAIEPASLTEVAAEASIEQASA